MPPPPLPTFTRPAGASFALAPLHSGLVQQMLASPATLLGKSFCLQSADIYYRIQSILLSTDEPVVFHLQYEDVR